MTSFNPLNMPRPVSENYAQISIAPAGRLAFIAGQVAIGLDGALVGPGDYHAQATQCFRNLAAALEALEAVPAQMVRMTIHVVNHSPETRPLVFSAGRDIFGDQWPVCASMLLGVQALGRPEWLVEIDATVTLTD